MPDPTSNTVAVAAAAKTPLFRATDVRAQADAFLSSGAAWLTGHWLQILIASGFAAVIVVALNAGRRLGARLCTRNPGAAGWGTILGRVIVRANNFFIVMLAAKLVGDTFAAAAPPPPIAKTIQFLWIVASTFQVASWARRGVQVASR